MTAEADGLSWREGFVRVFLSYISAEKGFASEVREALAPHRVDGFVAHEDIEPTAVWQDTIEACGAGSRWRAATMSPPKSTCARALRWLGAEYEKGLALVDLAQLYINTVPGKGHRRRPRQTLRQAIAILKRSGAAYDLERPREVERTL